MGPRRGARKIGDCIGFGRLFSCGFNGAAPGGAENHCELSAARGVFDGFNGAAPGGAENLMEPNWTKERRSWLQWGRAGGRGKSNRTLPRSRLHHSLQWGRAGGRGKSAILASIENLNRYASMGPRRGARKIRSRSASLQTLETSFNGAAPGGAENLKLFDPLARKGRCFNGAAPGGAENQLIRILQQPATFRFNGAAPGGAENPEDRPASDHFRSASMGPRRGARKIVRNRRS